MLHTVAGGIFLGAAGLSATTNSAEELVTNISFLCVVVLCVVTADGVAAASFLTASCSAKSFAILVICV